MESRWPCIGKFFSLKGLELDATWRPVDALTLTAGYTYLDAKYTDYETNVSSPLAASFVSSCTPVVIGTGRFCQTNFAGNRLERAPKHSFVATGRVQHAMTAILRGFVEGDLRYTGDRFSDDANKYIIPARTTVNMRVGVQSDRWTAIAFVDNLFDDNTIDSGISGGDNFRPGAAAFFLNAPERRKFGVRLAYKWKAAR